MTNRALFNLDGDTGDAGFLAAFGETLHIKLRATTGVSSWVVQVWSPDGFGYGIPILDNPPRASKSAPLLTLTGLTSGQSVVGALTGEVTTDIPASGINSWLVRSVVNGGMSGNPPRPDPNLVHERLVVTTSTVLRKPTATETNQYEVDSWAGVICDLVDAIVGGGGGGLIVGGTPLPGYTITAGAMATASWSLGPGFFVVGNHTLRDALPAYQMQAGVLVLTLNDGIVWQVASVGPVVFALWPGAGGVTSFATRTGAVVPAVGDYLASQVNNDSATVTGTRVSNALDNLKTSISALVTGVSSVFGRAGAVVAAVNDYAASQISNDSSVAGTGVKGALNTLLASLATTNSTVGSLVTGVSSVFTRTGAIVAVAGDYAASKINNDSATVSGTHVNDALDGLRSLLGSIFRNTYYVDPLYTGVHKGTQAEPYSSITAALAAAPSAGAVLIVPPGSSITESFTFPTAGKWELRCEDGNRATITGDINCSSSVQARYRITNIDVIGNIAGTATSATSVGSFLDLTTSSVSGSLTLSGSGSGFWFGRLRGIGSNFFAFGGAVNGAVSVAGQLFANNWFFGAAVTANSISICDYCRFPGGATALTMLALGMTLTNCTFTAGPTFTGPGSFALDGFTRSKANGFSLTAGATVTVINMVEPAGITQGGATGVNTQALMWNGSAWGPNTFTGAVSSVFGRVAVVVAAVGDYAASQINNDSGVTGATVKAALDNLKASITALVTGVSSFKTRTGAIVPAAGDYAASQVNNDSATVAGTHVSDSLDALKALIVASVTGVSSVFGRAGAVVAAVGDYAATKVNNDSTVAGVHVSDALNNLSAAIAAITSAVASWNGRTGTVVPVSGDYATVQITNDSSVVGATAKAALNTLLSSVNSVTSTVSALVTGVSSVFGRAGAVVAAVNDYAASQISNDSSVAGTGVKGALNTLLASLATTNSTVGSLVTGVSSVFTRTGAIVAVAGDYAASKINNDSATVSGTHVNDALDNLLLEYQSAPTLTTGRAFVLADVGTAILANSSGTITFTIPTNATMAARIGSKITVINISNGTVIIAPAAGGVVSISVGSALPTAPLTAYVCEKIGTNSWRVSAYGVLDAADISDLSSTIGGPTVRASVDFLHSSILSLTSNDIANSSTVTAVNVSDALDVLQLDIFALDSDIVNVSTVPGATITDALDTLNIRTLGDISLPISSPKQTGWTFGFNWAGSGGGGAIFIEGPALPMHVTLNSITITIDPALHGSLPTFLPSLELFLITPGGTTSLALVVDPSGSAAAYSVPHTIAITGLAYSPGTQTRLLLKLVDETGIGALSGTQLVCMSCNIS